MAEWFQSNVVVGEEVGLEAAEPLSRYLMFALGQELDSAQRPGDHLPGDAAQVVPGQSALIHPEKDVKPPLYDGEEISASMFEELARQVMGKLFSTSFRKARVEGIPKIFDFVSMDETIVGDAKFFTLVRGQDTPPAKFSIIAEHVWLLERTSAKRKFLVFGNDRRVPMGWLDRYRNQASGVEFYFLNHTTKEVERLN